ICYSYVTAGDVLLLVVAEALVGSCFHSCVDLLVCNVSFNNCCKDSCGTCRGRNTLCSADQFAVQFRNNKADCLGSAGAVGNDVNCSCTGSSQIAFSLRSVQSHLIACVSVDCAHDTGFDRRAIVKSLSHR